LEIVEGDAAGRLRSWQSDHGMLTRVAQHIASTPFPSQPSDGLVRSRNLASDRGRRDIRSSRKDGQFFCEARATEDRHLTPTSTFARITWRRASLRALTSFLR
jgi:hypothetical protein